MMLIWGSKITKKHGLVAAPVEGVMLALEQTWGAFTITIAFAKLITVFSNTSEGTFLRRDLLAMFGAMNLVVAYLFNMHLAFLKQKYGFDTYPFVILLSIEGLVYLGDAVLRERKVKSKRD